MKKLLGVSILVTLLAACADSGQGGAPQTETGRQVDVSEPGVAADVGTRPVISTGAVTEMPARPVPIPSGSEAKPESSDTAVSGPSTPESQGTVNEQGPQSLPEPATGDDANPDSVNPRR